MSPRMNGARALPFLLLAVTLCGLACKAPAFADLEKERPRQCNAEHACADGYTCVNGICVTGSPQLTECEPNAERACGDFDKGQCRKGLQKCGQDGKWDTVCVGEVRPTVEACNGRDDDCDGVTDDQIAPVACALSVGVCANKTQACLPGNLSQVCDATTYGAAYEVMETRCDNQDNDCDGQTDEDLTQACEKTRGVCGGTVKLCRNGAFPAAACTDDEYRARNSAYESFELTCDGLDNDCDGNSDRWDARNLSVTSAFSKTPVMALIPGGTGMSAVLMYQEDHKLLSQTVGPSGLGTPRVPSTTISVADSAYGAVLATDGQVLAASWIEEIGGTTRVMLTVLGADGTSALDKGGATTLFHDVSTLRPSKVSIAVNNGRIAVAVEDLSSGNIPIIRVTTVSASATGSSITLNEDRSVIVSTSGTTSRNPHVSPAASDTFFVAWQVDNKGISLRTLKPDGNLTPSVDGQGGPSAHSPRVFTTLPAGRTLLYYLETGDTQNALRVRECTAANCSTIANAPFSNAMGPSLSELTLVAPTFGEQPTVALWTEVGETGAIPVRYSAKTSDARYTLGTLTPDSANGAHPAATFIGAGSQRTLFAAFASDNSGGLTAGEIYLRPLCSF